MNALSSRLVFSVTLPSDYMDKIDGAVSDELKIAQQKWGIDLSEEAQCSVREHSINQLFLKVNSAFKTSWTFEAQIELKIKGLKKGSRGFADDLNLPSDLDKADGIRLVLTRDGFEVDDEVSDGALLVENLPDEILRMILKWIRTAVFYGVGSYRT